ncbi:MAG: hypothetical protein F4Z00_03835 [Acidimicrobiaceae bacterium]|nr:hypothetical protein [Acidimicrobiaceae bacterium]MXY11478.1 hypothetical protein [Acidimicrobiaceae bacterium]MXZ64663.1 hypothetical protein [Acidimicrobiaceae bacterium]MYA13968.1 hypothetical protein [Acidimicrobiaceae bacterium]MYE64437.1 hypothetical protein [Acidimicrobiaceae bacterium]
MTVPALVVMLTSVVTILFVSLHDHAGHAAAVDLAELRATHAAEAFLNSCLTTQGCEPPQGDQATACAAGSHGVTVTAHADWNPKLWDALTPVTAIAVIAYDDGLDNEFRARGRSALNAC